jgi:hypothetical protein
VIGMPDLFRTARAREIRQLLAEQTALLDDLLRTQREHDRRLGSTHAKLGGLRRTMDDGFAGLNSRLEHMAGLAQKLADKS